MDNQFRKTTALSLFIGSLLATITMILHPTGGSMEYIHHISGVIIFSHSLAIICLPFIGFGAWGLSELLFTPGRISMLGFYVFSMGLVAGMIAGAFNGLILPNFVGRYFNSGTDEEVLKVIMRYGYFVNAAMAYIFIAACTFAVGLWSVVIIMTGRLPKWIGYHGLIIVAIGLIGAVVKFNFISVWGFRAFIFGLVSWLVLAGIMMLRRND